MYSSPDIIIVIIMRHYEGWSNQRRWDGRTRSTQGRKA